MCGATYYGKKDHGLSILKVLLGLGRTNFKMDFLNTSKLTEFGTLKSNLFHSIITDGKNVFLKKAVLVGSQGILLEFLLLEFELLFEGIKLYKYK